jgi:hypothetical protein
MYRVTRSQQFINQFEKLCDDNPRLSDLGNALDWNLNRRPHDRAYALGNGFYLWITAELSANIPVVKIIYQVVDEPPTVRLLSIHLYTTPDQKLQ